MLSRQVRKQAEKTVAKLKQHGKILTAVESCTGGMVAAAITEIAGSSEIFKGSYVTYSNEEKHHMLGVSMDNLKKFGAVSEVVATEMALCGHTKSCGAIPADFSLSVTGFAGPGQDQDGVPVGRVYIALFNEATEEITVKKFDFPGNRRKVRQQATLEALKLVEHSL